VAAGVAPAGERRDERRRPRRTALATLIGRAKLWQRFCVEVTLLSFFSLYLGRAFESARQTVGYKRGCRPEKIHSFLSILDELSYDVV
jgi:hypothetical protein